MTDHVRRLAEETARQSYGKLLAILAKRSGDLAAAEDALATAFRAALEQWPQTGLPENPQAWLLTTARREQNRIWRHLAVADRATTEWLMRLEERSQKQSNHEIPDERLALMFACTHPSIDGDVATALMLQAVLGLSAEAIASAFLISPSTIGQRLVRAKSRLKAADTGFEMPALEDWHHRLDRVLAAIYAAFGMVWEDAALASEGALDLQKEAIWLARVLCQHLPDEAEAQGLLALMLYCEARRPARRNHTNQFVPLDRQDVNQWQWALIKEAESLLKSASARGELGRYQTEAAIQSVHIQSLIQGEMPATILISLYDLLASQWPSLGALVSRAAAYAKAGAHAQALAQLDELPPTKIANYQPYWATRAHILRTRNDPRTIKAFDQAIGLTSDPALREFLKSAKSDAAHSMSGHRYGS